MLQQIFFSIAVLFVVKRLLTWAYTRWRMPPGPLPLPVIGTLWTATDGRLTKLFERMGRYGRLTTVQHGRRLGVYINDVATLKEAFGRQALSDRPDYLFNSLVLGGKGLVAKSGDDSKEQRRFALHNLRDQGFGRLRGEEKIAASARHLVEELADYNGRAVDPEKALRRATTNVISSIVLGVQYEKGDLKLLELYRNFDSTMEAYTPLVDALDWLQYLPGDLFSLKKMEANRNHMWHYMQTEHIERRRREFDGTNVECFVDAYIQTLDRLKAEGSTSTLADEQEMQANLGTLFIAGTDTTSATLAWFILYLALDPDLQERVRDEIWTVIGRERMITTADRGSLPLLQATILETLRIRPPGPLGVAHVCNRDTYLNNYLIPERTLVFPNVIAIGHDPELFPDGDSFNPDRFFAPDPFIVARRKEAVMAFITGRRACIGESLARSELLVISATLLQRFQLSLPEGVTAPDLYGKRFHAILKPEPYRVQFVDLLTEMFDVRN